MAVSFIGEPRENHRPVTTASHWQTLSHNVVSSTCVHLTMNWVQTHNFSDYMH